MVKDMVKKIRRAPFNSEQLRELLIGHYEKAGSRAVKLKQSQPFRAIIRSYAQIFPEDASTIKSLFDYETVANARAASSKHPMKIRTDVFSKGLPSDGNMVKPCDDCPGNVRELVDHYLDEDEGEEEEAFTLPDDLFDDQPEPTPASTLVEVTDRKSLEEFFGVGTRQRQDIINDIRSYFKANNITYDGSARSMDALLDEFERLVVNVKK